MSELNIVIAVSTAQTLNLACFSTFFIFISGDFTVSEKYLNDIVSAMCIKEAAEC